MRAQGPNALNLPHSNFTNRDSYNKNQKALGGVSGFSIDRLAQNLGMGNVHRNSHNPYQGLKDGRLTGQ